MRASWFVFIQGRYLIKLHAGWGGLGDMWSQFLFFESHAIRKNIWRKEMLSCVGFISSISFLYLLRSCWPKWQLPEPTKFRKQYTPESLLSPHALWGLGDFHQITCMQWLLPCHLSWVSNLVFPYLLNTRVQTVHMGNSCLLMPI